MRIISGILGGRRLKAVPSHKTRPTTDRVKESLFNMIGPYFNGGTFLDLYSGSGNVAIEAVSRGIKKAIMVDHQYAAYKTILDNISVTKLPKRFDAFKSSANLALKKMMKLNDSFNYVYLDPPYRKQQMIKDLLKLSHFELLRPKALVICETDNNVHLKDDVKGYHLLKQKRYGLTILTIYRYLGE